MTARTPFWCVEWHARLGSTMERAGELAELGAPSGMVVVADYQERGRGTHGRSWVAPPGTCLTFTVLARPCIAIHELEALPQRVGAAVARALWDNLQLDCTIKLPNDLLVNDRKLSGVLCSSRVVGDDVRWVLVGIGLNTAMRAEQLPVATATSLSIEGLAPPAHATLLEWLLAELAFLR